MQGRDGLLKEQAAALHAVGVNIEVAAFGSALVPHLYRDFEVEPFDDPAVVWLNKRFLASHGVDVGDEQSLSAWRTRLADMYGVTSTSAAPPSSVRAHPRTFMHADRYGGPFGSQHGGSGRSGTIGEFNAKGVGRTPLCDPEADFYHAHGCMWLEEAIREAAFAELAWFEFPLRANPAVAIIDTGARHVGPDGTVGERRAIVVRPAAWRVAHLERSIFFGSVGTADSDQYLDALRVKEAICTLPQIAATAAGEPGIAPCLHAFAAVVANVAQQIGSGRAARLAHGDYSSGNIGLSGELLDFGSFRAVHDWRQAHSVRGIAPFGQEHINLVPSIENVYSSILKYTAERPTLTFAQMIGVLVDGMAQAFTAEIDALAAPFAEVSPRLAEFITDQLNGAYTTQQRASVNYLTGDRGDNIDWIYDALTGAGSGLNSTSAIGRAIRQAVSAEAERRPAAASQLGAAFNRLCYWARPKTRAGREILQQKVNRVLAGSPSRAELEPAIDRLINDLLTSARRTIGRGRDDYVVAQRFDSSYSATVTHRPPAGTFCFTLEALHQSQFAVDPSGYGAEAIEVPGVRRTDFPFVQAWEFSGREELDVFFDQSSVASGLALVAQDEHPLCG